ncbi:TPM domain-containing protein [Oceanicola sp. D3]|uniref:TPM domain-containing protein n=1 Tax=Oceanicola sp. D3 TaxID=2587163 RepID=UPI00111E0F69|nr:TPM domain-containing protein [Oceanicola sp. D3]QDC09935.1 TPM domain-containing protein [Oceanicola sp. D3]
MTFHLRVFRPAHFLLAVLALILLPAAAMAQSYPELPASYVLDEAGVLSDAQETELAEAIAKVKTDTGVELAVVTVMSTADYGGFDGLEAFTTGLFNEWGLGDEEKADGILIFLARADREVRIELGSGLQADYGKESARIIDEVMLPAFREDRYGDGITEGTKAVITRIATPYATPASASGGETAAASGEAEGEGGGSGGAIMGGIGAAIVALIGFVVFKSKQAKANRVCESCGAKGQVEITRRTVQDSTETSTGVGEKTTACGACGHSSTERYTISKKSKSSSAAKTGGGKSEGGGASGKW